MFIIIWSLLIKHYVIACYNYHYTTLINTFLLSGTCIQQYLAAYKFLLKTLLNTFSSGTCQ